MKLGFAFFDAEAAHRIRKLNEEVMTFFHELQG
jgi:hypothetical protein